MEFLVSFIVVTWVVCIIFLVHERLTSRKRTLIHFRSLRDILRMVKASEKEHEVLLSFNMFPNTLECFRNADNNYILRVICPSGSISKFVGSKEWVAECAYLEYLKHYYDEIIEKTPRRKRVAKKKSKSKN